MHARYNQLFAAGAAIDQIMYFIILCGDTELRLKKIGRSSEGIWMSDGQFKDSKSTFRGFKRHPEVMQISASASYCCSRHNLHGLDTFVDSFQLYYGGVLMFFKK
jgi:hypothetical protein